MIKKILAFIILISLFSCKSFNEDSYPIIENRYKIIQGPSNEIDLILKSNNQLMVQGHILFYGHNPQYIILNRKPSDSIVKIDSKLNLPQREKIIFNTTYNQYFIVEVKSERVYGPYNKSEYLDSRKKLNIPGNLKFTNSTLEFYVDGQRNDIDYHKNLDPEVMDLKNLKGNKVSSVFFN